MSVNGDCLALPLAARPYAAFVNTTNVKSIRPATQRDAGWDVQREGRETKVEPPTGPVKLYTVDFGTSVRHPSSERIATAYLDRNQFQREYTAVRPYAESLRCVDETKTYFKMPDASQRKNSIR